MCIFNANKAYKILNRSTVAIVILEKTPQADGKFSVKWIPRGTGFFVSERHVLTAGHLFTDSATDNPDKYCLLRRKAENEKNYNLKSANLNFINAKKIIIKRDFDVALLEFDFSSTKKIMEEIGLWPVKPLKLDFCEKRQIGDEVYWMGMATIGDVTAIPRFFSGQIVVHYINDSNYQFPKDDGTQENFNARSLKMIEVNNLFLPGCSGSPVFSRKNKAVIGFVHGYGAWPIGLTPGGEIDIPKAKIKIDNQEKEVDLHLKPPVFGAISRVIDVSLIKEFLTEQK